MIEWFLDLNNRPDLPPELLQDAVEFFRRVPKADAAVIVQDMRATIEYIEDLMDGMGLDRRAAGFVCVSKRISQSSFDSEARAAGGR